MRNLIAALALLVPTLTLAAPKGKMAPTKATLTAVIRSEMGSYQKVPKNQLNSKKFTAFTKNPNNFQRLDLTPGMRDAGMVAFVATRVYPGKVFVNRWGWGPKGVTSKWTKGTLPKF